MSLTLTLVSCKTTPSGADSQDIIASRAATGAIMSKDMADQIKRQQTAVGDEYDLDDKKHDGTMRRIHDGLDIVNRVACLF